MRKVVAIGILCCLATTVVGVLGYQSASGGEGAAGEIKEKTLRPGPAGPVLSPDKGSEIAASEAGNIAASALRYIYLFFPRDGYQNPGGVARNWYYYWRDGQVVQPMSGFLYEDSDDFGYYDPNSDKLYVCNAAPTEDGYQKTLRNMFINSGVNGIVETKAKVDDWQAHPFNAQIGANRMAIGRGKNQVLDSQAGGDDRVFSQELKVDLPLRKGLYMCATTCVHEKYHRFVFKNLAGTCLITDSDCDDLINTYEEGRTDLNLDPKNPDTYDVAFHFNNPEYKSYGDDELLCRLEETKPVDSLVAAGSDWSDTNGHNWLTLAMADKAGADQGLVLQDGSALGEPAVQQIHDANTLAEIAPFIRDRSQEARIEAIKRVGDIGDPAGVELLAQQFDQCPYRVGIDYVPSEKIVITEAIADIGGDQARTVLMGLFKRYWTAGPQDKEYCWADGDYLRVMYALMKIFDSRYRTDASIGEMEYQFATDERSGKGCGPMRTEAYRCFLENSMARAGVVSDPDKAGYLVNQMALSLSGGSIDEQGQPNFHYADETVGVGICEASRSLGKAAMEYLNRRLVAVGSSDPKLREAIAGTIRCAGRGDGVH